MFGADAYVLGVPVDQKTADKLNELIISIARQEPSLGVAKDLTKKIVVKPEFHVTLGVFHPGVFQSNKGLFKHLLNFLRTHPGAYAELKKLFNGKCTIKGIGFDKHDVKSSDVVWAAVESSEVHAIRVKVHEILGLAGIEDSSFIFTNPHITLLMKSGKGDVHDIGKPLKLPLHGFLDERSIDFDFETTNFYGKHSKVVASFGRECDGKPSDKFKKVLTDAINADKPKEVEYNWGALFKSADFRAQAKEIKTILTDPDKGAKELAKLLGKDMGAVMKLLKS
ncbi:hypothetical protein HN592_04780 [Candidatus Woesearchaeota archaeon]|jgi:hypothetical protein|nr:hypothetical protein [Candidatus Woesearchaeota archaeon]MBT4368528.1 hypothetical protein [Candidatus Woesearchaeota archaeon]MBT4713017.1 hypothetical protein [Candidatus Woesearchaeota archaeon]MBT6639929.1 hypothetical protein [Candidatus Woesearchaeota archaeon]MBT7134101.1 hypothetical protein [Candidatus Woesearchaeota archaeon]